MDEGQEQLVLVADSPAVKARTRTTKKSSVVPATTLPYAQVRVDISVAHLDRDFDYLVPQELESTATVGSKVRVRFHGKLTDAIVIRRTSQTSFTNIQPIERVVGPALTEQTLQLVLSVTERYAGLFWDVVRSAVPAKHGRVTGSASMEHVTPSSVLHGNPWMKYERGEEVKGLLASGSLFRGCWASAPSSDWRDEVRDLVSSALQSSVGAGVLVVVPDAKNVVELAAFCQALDPTILSAELGAKERYRSFLNILAGNSSFVIGTRSAIFAPVSNLSLIVLWDDGNDNLSEPHAPYWDAREVAALRSHSTGCSLMIGAHSRSVVTQSWCDSGWSRELNPTEQARKEVMGKVRGMFPEDAERDPAKARIPHIAWQAVKKGIEQGPVLIQVARKGYIPAFVCRECGERAVCSCGGGVEINRVGSYSHKACSRCGTTTWTCACGGRDVNALSIGAERTAEEIGRAFAGTPVLWSQAERVIAKVDATPRIVVATPGAEPVAEDGYRAVVALDATTGAISLLAQEMLLRRLFSAAVLAAPGAEIVLVAPAEDRAIQAVSRWESSWAARRELAERTEANLPPSCRVAQLRGMRSDVESVANQVLAIPTLRILGPVDDNDHGKAHAYLLVSRAHGPALTSKLAEITRVRSADPRSQHVQIRIDPRDF